MTKQFIRDYKKLIGYKNVVLFTVGVITIIISILFLFQNKVFLSIIFLYIYLLFSIIYIVIKSYIVDKSVDFSLTKIREKSKKRKIIILKQLILKYKIENIELFYQSVLSNKRVVSKTRISFFAGFSLFLTIFQYFIGAGMTIDIERLKSSIIMTIIYCFFFSVFDFLRDLLKLVNNDEHIYEEISELLLEMMIIKTNESINFRKVFLEKLALGRKTNFKDSEEIIEKCIVLAYKDMLSSGRYYINRINEFSKETFIVSFKKLLIDNNYVYSRNMIDNIVPLFGKNEVIGEKNNYVTRYGLSQKIYNMTYKYFYCFNEYLRDLNINYPNCDCPLDTVILEKINCNTVWSKMDKNTYINCQKQIQIYLNCKEELNEDLRIIGNLAYDFLMW